MTENISISENRLINLRIKAAVLFGVPKTINYNSDEK